MTLVGSLVSFVLPAAAAQEAKEPANSEDVSPQAKKINELIRKGYESAGIQKTADRARDEQYIRRVFIDLIGRIPTPEELVDYLCDSRRERRVKLVKRLLGAGPYTLRNLNGQPGAIIKNYADEYAEHWANIWTVRLMTRTVHPVYRGQMHAWLRDHFSVAPSRAASSHKEMVIQLLTATGQVGGNVGPSKPEYAANFILHHLGDPVKECDEGAFDAVPITSRVTRLFLGLQTHCLQCHDHPLNKEWEQSDFWGVNAFFRQTVREGTPSPVPDEVNNESTGNAAPLRLTDSADVNVELIVYFERRDGRLIGTLPTMLKDYAKAQVGEKSRKVLISAQKRTRRAQLAEWVVAHDNFSRAYANRLWSHFFGRGLNQDPAADDFSSNNELVHPELLDYLATEFARHNFDPKRLMEWIVTSDAYQLSHVGAKDSLDPKFDRYFARMPMKAMSPEVLFESLLTATSASADRKNPAGMKFRRTTRDPWLRKLVQQFGDQEGNELDFKGTIVQSLLMMNGAELNSEIGTGRYAGKALQELLKKHQGNSDRIYEDLFLLTLSRSPTMDEVAILDDVRKAAGRVPSDGKGELGFYQDLHLALLNTSEFMINH